jgi:hypothetical protein
MDFNQLEYSAEKRFSDGDYDGALTIYYFMVDGDPSLDAGHLGERIGACYLSKGCAAPARYWLRRAQEENPELYGHLSRIIDSLEVSPENLLYPLPSDYLNR